MKLRNRFAIRGAAFSSALLLKALSRTLRLRVRSRDGEAHPRDPAVQPCIYALWHESMLAPCRIRSKVQILISQSADGELIAQTCRWLGLGVIRGSSSKGGAPALLELTHRAQRGDSHLLFTPDGPRGPRRTVQPGIIFLSSRTGLPIVPVGVGFTRAWRARSWDRFAVPLPFSTLTAIVGPPMTAPSNLSSEGLSYHQRRLEQLLNQATSLAERWAGRASRRATISHIPMRGVDHDAPRIGRHVA